ncbi:MAG TPA: thiamine phosphate synthase [Caulobacteraceae bacterium]|nr:thiamine phosphate synthase [Caulobacteraceae bacterium]
MTDDAAQTLWRTAQALEALARPEKPLPPLFFVTDPLRTPDPAAVAARLPVGAGVIYRHFGAEDALPTAMRLREIAGLRALTLLIGLDAELAEACGAHGVHLPEAGLGQARELRAGHPEWLLTAAAHGAGALEAAASAGVDAALLSPVFPSASPSAGPPLGLARFSELARGAPLPVYALGGVTAANVAELLGSGAAGVAAVEGVLEAWAAGQRA